MNKYHRSAIAVTFQHIDSQLAQIEAILQALGSKSPLSAYAFDVGAAEQVGIMGYLQRIREKMWAAMQRLEAPADTRRVSATWSIQVSLIGILVDLANIEPQRLGGHGPVAPQAAVALAGILADLQRLVNGLHAYIRRAHGQDVADRLARLTTSPAGRASLALIEQVIMRHELVELRPVLDMIVSRLEANELEVAFFGRVSSGKSSLLNYLLGSEVLPVGVLPVTAVLTRLRRAEQPELTVYSDLSPPRREPIERIGEFVTEEGNPRNTRRVSAVVIGLPAPRLVQGVTLIDTPGVGSLATVGAAQTKAYLPRCDLAVLLVDAGSTLDSEDLAMLRGFHESAIAGMILVSKSDLLSAADRDRVVEYIRRQTGEALEVDVPVHLVSTRGPDARLADRWFEEQIVPILDRHGEHLEASMRRKIANLVELAAAHLAARLDSAGAAVSVERSTVARRILKDMDDRIAVAAASISEPIDRGVEEQVTELILAAARELVARARRGDSDRGLLREFVAVRLADMAGQTRARLMDLAKFLADGLRQLAADGDVGDAGWLDGSLAEFEPLPRADEERLSSLPQARCSRLLAAWTSVAEWSQRSELRREAGLALWSLIHDHRLKLRRWLEVNLQHMLDAFEARVAVFRARFGGTAEQGASDETVARIRADLAALRAASASSERSSSQSPAATAASA